VATEPPVLRALVEPPAAGAPPVLTVAELPPVEGFTEPELLPPVLAAPPVPLPEPPVEPELVFTPPVVIEPPVAREAPPPTLPLDGTEETSFVLPHATKNREVTPNRTVPLTVKRKLLCKIIREEVYFEMGIIIPDRSRGFLA